MFGEIPKILDRNFLVGYFLPAFLLVSASLWLVHGKNPLIIGNDPVKLGAFAIALPLITGVLLLALNGRIFRLFEGSGRQNPFRLLSTFAHIHYEIITTSARRTWRQGAEAKGDTLAELTKKYRDIQSKLAERFPPKRGSLLPTALGNAINSFEEYSREMYGFDAVEGWPRLLAVIPKDYRDLIDSSKAETDFWINLWLVSLLLAADYVFSKLCAKLIVAHDWQHAALMSKILRGLPSLWPNGLILLLTTLVLGWISARGAMRSAIEWGVMVKSAFDVFLPELYSKLGFTSTCSSDEVKSTWYAFSQAIVYRLPNEMPSRFGVRNSKKTQPLR